MNWCFHGNFWTLSCVTDENVAEKALQQSGSLIFATFCRSKYLLEYNLIPAKWNFFILPPGASFVRPEDIQHIFKSFHFGLQIQKFYFQKHFGCVCVIGKYKQLKMIRLARNCFHAAK